MITDPQTQSSYDQVDPNANAVENTPVGGQEDNQRVLARQTPSGTSRGVQQLGGPSLQADSGSKQITVTDIVPQVLMGSQPNFGEGFYVTKPGVDVTTATNPSDFNFNSNQNNFKIVKTDLITIGLSASTVSTLSIPHGLKFAPIPLAFLVNVGVAGPVTNANLPLPTFVNADVGGTVPGVITFGSYLYTAADTVNVHFQFLNATGASPGTFNLRYYLLEETSGRK